MDSNVAQQNPNAVIVSHILLSNTDKLNCKHYQAKYFKTPMPRAGKADSSEGILGKILLKSEGRLVTVGFPSIHPVRSKTDAGEVAFQVIIQSMLIRRFRKLPCRIQRAAPPSQSTFSHV